MNAIYQLLVRLSEKEGPWEGFPIQDRTAATWIEFVISVAIISVMIIHFT